MSEGRESLLQRFAQFAGRSEGELAALFGSQGSPPWEPKAAEETPPAATADASVTVKSPGKVK